MRFYGRLHQGEGGAMFWYCLELGDFVRSAAPSAQILEGVMARALSRAQSGQRPDYSGAVFQLNDIANNAVTVYFSPSMATLAKSYGAKECEKPIPTRGFALLAGEAAAWDAHFPEYAAQIRSGRGPY